MQLLLALAAMCPLKFCGQNKKTNKRIWVWCFKKKSCYFDSLFQSEKFTLAVLEYITHCAFAFLHFLPNGHEFMGPWPIPTLISISLEFCFQHNFLPYWRFPPLHFLEEFLQNHSFSRAPLVENVKTKENLLWSINSQKYFG